MARVFKTTYPVTGKDGKRVRRRSRKWYIEYRDDDGAVHHYRNIGGPTSAAFEHLGPCVAPGSRGAAAPEFTDIDADGDLDLFVGMEDGFIYFYRNLGTPASADWSLVATRYAGIGVGRYNLQAKFADLDEDADHDLVTTDHHGAVGRGHGDVARTTGADTLAVDVVGGLNGVAEFLELTAAGQLAVLLHVQPERGIREDVPEVADRTDAARRAAWRAAMDSAAEHGLDGEIGGRSIRDQVTALLERVGAAYLAGRVPCGGSNRAALASLDALALRHGIRFRP